MAPLYLLMEMQLVNLTLYEAPTTGKVTSYQNVDTPTLMVAESKTEYKIEK